MKQIPKIILDKAEDMGLDRMAAYLCDVNGGAIYSLGVDSSEHWFPCPPQPLELVSLKNGVIVPFHDIALISRLLESD